MIRNRNGYWMSPKWFAMFAPDDGGGNGGEGGSGAGEGAGTDGAGDAGGEGGEGSGDDVGGADSESASEIARLKAEIAKQKVAIDKATKEAAAYKRDLRAKQSAEEIAAEEKKTADEAAKAELDALRKEVAQAKTVKSVMSKLGTDETASAKIAEFLYGAEDPDAALAEIQKAWMAKEKALKLEYGKLKPPEAGGENGADAETQKALELAKKLGQSRATNNKSVRDGLSGYMR